MMSDGAIQFLAKKAKSASFFGIINNNKDILTERDRIWQNTWSPHLRHLDLSSLRFVSSKAGLEFLFLQYLPSDCHLTFSPDFVIILGNQRILDTPLVHHLTHYSIGSLIYFFIAWMITSEKMHLSWKSSSTKEDYGESEQCNGH